MMTFLKTILIVLLVYFALKFLIRLATPYLVRYIKKKAGQQLGQIFGNPPPSKTSPHREGKVTIENIPRPSRSPKKKVGEYVEYEEVD